MRILGHSSREIKMLCLVEVCAASILASANYLPGFSKEPLDWSSFSVFARTMLFVIFLVFEFARSLVFLVLRGHARRLLLFVFHWPLILAFIAFLPVAYLWHDTFHIPYESTWFDVEAAPTPSTKSGAWVQTAQTQFLIRHGVIYFTKSSFVREEYAGARPFGGIHWNYPAGGYGVTIVWPDTRFLGFDLTWNHGPFGGWVSVAMPLWLGGVPFLVILARRLIRRKPPLGLCAKCSYDLRAHKSGDKCPECGTMIPALDWKKA